MALRKKIQDAPFLGSCLAYSPCYLLTLSQLTDAPLFPDHSSWTPALPIKDGEGFTSPPQCAPAWSTGGAVGRPCSPVGFPLSPSLCCILGETNIVHIFSELRGFEMYPFLNLPYPKCSPRHSR